MLILVSINYLNSLIHWRNNYKKWSQFWLINLPYLGLLVLPENSRDPGTWGYWAPDSRESENFGKKEALGFFPASGKCKCFLYATLVAQFSHRLHFPPISFFLKGREESFMHWLAVWFRLAGQGIERFMAIWVAFLVYALHLTGRPSSWLDKTDRWWNLD